MGLHGLIIVDLIQLRGTSEHNQTIGNIVMQSILYLKNKGHNRLFNRKNLHVLRYSILLKLPYFDPIQYAVIDPMHNLFLGTGRHVMEVWLERHSHFRQNIAILESQIKVFIVPEGIGQLPCKISSHFGSFTADQWRNWITIYSPVLMWSILERESWDC